uniref:EF-hand domain-containing protein n=1 Tax=Alexandrium catenella TaxID=2925 RepID=A0A7S1Q583_ALECA|mmetsp:Transcript_19348/g.52660  ORF Transcript_19348/g.52660 Transcript_19348/m.52660 type:complete len:665 (+) Transcript_19348:83-2077(+)
MASTPPGPSAAKMVNAFPSERSQASGMLYAFPSARRKETSLGGSMSLSRGMTRERDHWSDSQRRCARVLRSWMTEAVLGVFIAVSFILVVIETDIHGEVPAWIPISNYLLLCVYVVEVGARMFVLRLAYFSCPFSIMDLTIVCTDLVVTLAELILSQEPMPSLTFWRIFRLLRLTRSYKLIVHFPQLALMVRGLINAAYAVMYGVALLTVVLLVWSICAVQFIQPVNLRVASKGLYAGCDRCESAFASVPESCLTFVQQIIAGDSWGLVTIPIVEESPFTGLFFAAVFVSVHLAIVNVILAVIVDAAMRASKENDDRVTQNKAEEYEKARKKFTRMCEELDTDGSGDLTWQEFAAGLYWHEEFHDALASLDVTEGDMSLVFSILDTASTGTVKYEDFATELFKMKQHDTRTMLIFIKHYVTEIKRSLEQQIASTKSAITGQIRASESAHIAPHMVEVAPDSRRTSRVSREPPLQNAAPEQCRSSKASEERWSSKVPEEPALAGAEQGKRARHSRSSSLEPKAQQLEQPPGQMDDMFEEVRRLRLAISEDLARSLRSIAEQTEVNTRLLASVAPESPVARGGDPASLRTEFTTQDAWRLGEVPGEVIEGRLTGGAAAPSLRPMPTSAWALRACCGSEALSSTVEAALQASSGFPAVRGACEGVWP